MDDVLTTSPRFGSVWLFIRALLGKVYHPNFKELYVETPCWCPCEVHQQGGRKVTEVSVVEFAIKTKSYYPRAQKN